MQSTLTLTTSDGDRIIKRLGNHWRHKFAVSTDEQGATVIPFADDDKAVLTADGEQLTCVLTTADDETMTKLQGVIVNHINRMAGVEFEAVWA